MSKVTWGIIAVLAVIVVIIIIAKAKGKSSPAPTAPESTYLKMEPKAPIASDSPWKGYYGTT